MMLISKENKIMKISKQLELLLLLLFDFKLTHFLCLCVYYEKKIFFHKQWTSNLTWFELNVYCKWHKLSLSLLILKFLKDLFFDNNDNNRILIIIIIDCDWFYIEKMSINKFVWFRLIFFSFFLLKSTIKQQQRHFLFDHDGTTTTTTIITIIIINITTTTAPSSIKTP